MEGKEEQMRDEAKATAEEERAKRIRLGMESDPRDARHGTEYARYGCSCAKCAAWRAKCERGRKKRGAEARMAGRSELDGKGRLLPLWKDSHDIDVDKAKIAKRPVFTSPSGSHAVRNTKYCG